MCWMIIFRQIYKQLFSTLSNALSSTMSQVDVHWMFRSLVIKAYARPKYARFRCHGEMRLWRSKNAFDVEIGRSMNVSADGFMYALRSTDLMMSAFTSLTKYVYYCFHICLTLFRGKVNRIFFIASSIFGNIIWWYATLESDWLKIMR